MSRFADRLGEIDQRRLDLALAAFLTTLTLVFILTSEKLEGPLLVNVAVAASVTLALAWRRSHPIAVALTSSAGFVLLTLLLTPAFEFPPATFALMIASYSVGANRSDRWTYAGLIAVSTAITTVAIIETPDDIVFPLAIFGFMPWLIGRTMQTQIRLGRELAEQEARVRHLREQEAATAVQGERNRVARELHDVLAHNLSVMVIQASAGRRAIAVDPGGAMAAADLIERTGREALVELRHMFGPVRHGEGEALEGSPGLDGLERLVERSRAAGLPVSLRTSGNRVELPSGADMAAYRVVQEALTNILKHAGSATTEVSVEYRPDLVAVSVSDAGDAAVPPAVLDSGGHGLVGMRERVGVYGGDMEAGPRERGGFAVRATLPVSREAAMVS